MYEYSVSVKTLNRVEAVKFNSGQEMRQGEKIRNRGFFGLTRQINKQLPNYENTLIFPFFTLMFHFKLFFRKCKKDI